MHESPVALVSLGAGAVGPVFTRGDNLDERDTQRGPRFRGEQSSGEIRRGERGAARRDLGRTDSGWELRVEVTSALARDAAALVELAQSALAERAS